jgi:hypothetical protein
MDRNKRRNFTTRSNLLSCKVAVYMDVLVTIGAPGDFGAAVGTSRSASRGTGSGSVSLSALHIGG